MDLQDAITEAIRKYYSRKENVFKTYEKRKGSVRYTPEYFDKIEDDFLTEKEKGKDETK